MIHKAVMTKLRYKEKLWKKIKKVEGNMLNIIKVVRRKFETDRKHNKKFKDARVVPR